MPCPGFEDGQRGQEPSSNAGSLSKLNRQGNRRSLRTSRNIQPGRHLDVSPPTSSSNLPNCKVIHLWHLSHSAFIGYSSNRKLISDSFKIYKNQSRCFWADGRKWYKVQVKPVLTLNVRHHNTICVAQSHQVRSSARKVQQRRYKHMHSFV